MEARNFMQKGVISKQGTFYECDRDASVLGVSALLSLPSASKIFKEEIRSNRALRLKMKNGMFHWFGNEEKMWEEILTRQI